MYRVIKAKGTSSNVVVENMETKANVIIGRISMEILRILEGEGHKTTDDSLVFADEWNFPISKTAATELTRLTMKMKKPIRDQSKKAKETTPKKDNKQIDAMDVLLGLASYN